MISRFIDKYRQMFMSFATSDLVRAHSKKIRCEIRESILRQNILNSTSSGVTDHVYEEGRQVIVSLTTFGERILWIGPAIESIMEQTVKANKIVLWLGHEFEKPHMIPQDLRMLEKRGLEIRFTEDCGPATKLIPSLKAFPDDIIITIDDDTLYSYDLLDKLIRGHYRYPDAIITDYIDTIVADNGSFRYGLNTPESRPVIPTEPDIHPVALGVSGVLYPPKSMHPDVTDTDLFRKLSPKADDVWFKIMQLRAGTPVFCVCGTHPDNERLISMEHHDPSLSLYRYNLLQGGNDKQLAALFEHFPEVRKYYTEEGR